MEEKLVHWHAARCILGEDYEGQPNDGPRTEDSSKVTCPVCRLALALD